MLVVFPEHSLVQLPVPQKQRREFYQEIFLLVGACSEIVMNRRRQLEQQWESQVEEWHIVKEKDAREQSQSSQEDVVQAFEW